MARTGENETEILLGNKQLLGIFFVVAILLGIAFTGGYMVGRDSLDKKTADATTAPVRTPSAVETHAVPPDTSTNDAQSGAEPSSSTTNAGSRVENADNATPLGSKNSDAKTAPAAIPRTGDDFVPQKGQTFLQVAAVGRDEAEAISDVLRKKGFRAHAAPKPGSAKVYRVLIGPVHDAADLSSTRDSLRKTGFRDVIPQHY